MSRLYPRRPYDRNPRVRRDDPEPTIRDLLADPVLQALMARDRVGRAELLDIVDVARMRLGIAEPRTGAAIDPAFADCT
jgi:hypothetical protein